MQSVTHFLNSFSLNSLHTPSLGPGSLSALLIVVIILLFALSLGRTRVLISLLSIYVAFTLQAIFPFFGQLQKSVSFTHDLATLRVIVFLALYVVILGLLNRSVLLAHFNLSEAAFFSVIFMGLIELGFLISIVLNLAPSFYWISGNVPASVLPYFATQRALFYWALAPLVMVVFSKRSNTM